MADLGEHGGAAAPPLNDLQARRRGDPVQPVIQRRPALIGVQAAPGPDHGLLQGVLGLIERAEHPVTVQVQRPAMRRDHRTESRIVARAGGGEQTPGINAHQLGVHRLGHIHAATLTTRPDKNPTGTMGPTDESAVSCGSYVGVITASGLPERGERHVAG